MDEFHITAPVWIMLTKPVSGAAMGMLGAEARDSSNRAPIIRSDCSRSVSVMALGQCGSSSMTM